MFLFAVAFSLVSVCCGAFPPKMAANGDLKAVSTKNRKTIGKPNGCIYAM